MSEPFADDLRMNVALERDRRVRVPQIIRGSVNARKRPQAWPIRPRGHHRGRPRRSSVVPSRRINGAKNAANKILMERTTSFTPELGPYKRHELLTGKIFNPMRGYTGYGDGKSTNVADFHRRRNAC